MKNIVISALIATGLATTTISAFLNTTSTQLLAEDSTAAIQISCGQAQDPSSKSVLPATIAKVAGSEEATVLIVWKSERFEKFPPQRRCEIVSPKFQAAIGSNRTYLMSGKDPKNGLGIVCAASTKDEACDSAKMLFTLKSYQNADNTIEQLALLLNGKTNIPIYQNSGGKYVANLRDLLKIKK